MSASVEEANDRSDLRPGEIAITLPDAFDAGLYFIGRIRTPWTRREDCPKNAGASDAICSIVVDPRYAAALDKVDTCSHLVVLYWMDQARRDLVVQTPRHYGEGRGTFALRSPVRPNPVALSVVTLLNIEATTLSIRHIDCIDNTPLIDIKPYFVSVDSKPDASVGWHRDRDQVSAARPRQRVRAKRGPMTGSGGEPVAKTGFPLSRE